MPTSVKPTELYAIATTPYLPVWKQNWTEWGSKRMTPEDADRVRYEALRVLVNEKADELEVLLDQLRERTRRIVEGVNDGDTQTGNA